LRPAVLKVLSASISRVYREPLAFHQHGVGFGTTTLSPTASMSPLRTTTVPLLMTGR
jgi:hypothetical protein